MHNAELLLFDSNGVFGGLIIDWGVKGLEDANIEKLIASLKKEQANSKKGTLKLLIPGDNEPWAVCVWNQGTNESYLLGIQAEHGWYFPDDYQSFLRVSDGCLMFTHPHYGGGIDLLNLQRIINIHDEMEQIPSHWYPIAWTDYIAGAICIDSERCRNNIFPYIFFLDAMKEISEAIPIHCDFKTWFERLILCQGSEFWLWEYHDKINFRNEN
ncbi:SMI1/KNR4 family protein [Paenibacillus sp. F411]|uniref:SMI1/KNR4 family protein n=1 Tax=Paenibacillus sp. F411 TaxID=2820239 RepID=UPI001AAFA181|nr:SMI1/KNR4 family protein [Paenibacillus sp. F411]MBO2942455.1 SMI1/KNR4 family protein [Paenibacillus sp. F411]